MNNGVKLSMKQLVHGVSIFKPSIVMEHFRGYCPMI